MPNPTPETEMMKISEVKSHLSSLVNEVYRNEKRILIEKSGIPVAAVVSIGDLERLSRFDREWKEAFAVVDEMREAFKDIPPDRIEREVAALVRELRDDEEMARRATERQPA